MQTSPGRACLGPTCAGPTCTKRSCAMHMIRTQSTVRGICGIVAAGRWAAQRDDMADLQAAVMDDDALDDELQDGLLVSKARLIEPATDALAKGGEILENGLGLHLLAASLADGGKLLLKSCTLIGKRTPPLVQLGQGDHL